MKRTVASAVRTRPGHRCHVRRTAAHVVRLSGAFPGRVRDRSGAIARGDNADLQSVGGTSRRRWFRGWGRGTPRYGRRPVTDGGRRRPQRTRKAPGGAKLASATHGPPTGRPPAPSHDRAARGRLPRGGGHGHGVERARQDDRPSVVDRGIRSCPGSTSSPSCGADGATAIGWYAALTASAQGADQGGLTQLRLHGAPAGRAMSWTSTTVLEHRDAGRPFCGCSVTSHP